MALPKSAGSLTPPSLIIGTSNSLEILLNLRTADICFSVAPATLLVSQANPCAIPTFIASAHLYDSNKIPGLTEFPITIFVLGLNSFSLFPNDST